jgi:altronate dehydratase large subunit
MDRGVAVTDKTFLGFRREGGRAGVRNETLVLAVNGLVGGAARRIAAAMPDARPVATPYGRGQIGPDKEAHLQQLVGLGANPNVGAALILGADRKSADAVAGEIGRRSSRPLDVLTLDDVHEDALELTARGIRACARLVRETSKLRREPVPVSELYLGIECGHSDATSGLTSNRLAGAVVDRLVDKGGSAVIGETIEWLGAEHSLRGRARDAAIGEAIVQAVLTREASVAALGVDLLGNNPGEENIRGGLSTIEEKSLGAIAKSGTRPIQDLLSFAAPPQTAGLHLMEGPSFSPESMTGFVASGVQMILFSTGPGNSYCSLLAPTIKISANPDTRATLGEQIDFDASPNFVGRESLDATADRLLARVLDFASGTLTWGEVLREGAECFYRTGASL